MTSKHTLILDVDESTQRRLEKNVLEPAGHALTTMARADQVPEGDFDLIFVGDRSGGNPLDHLETIQAAHPASPILLLTQRNRAGALTLQALEKGAAACLAVPIKVEDVLAAVSHALSRRRQLIRWAAKSATSNDDAGVQLQQLQTAAALGQRAAALRTPEEVLRFMIQQAVAVSDAETGRLYLLDPDGRTLRLRAAHDFESAGAQTLSEIAADKFAEKAISSQQPVLIPREHTAEDGSAESEPHSRTQLYVPLAVDGQSIGALEVSNGSRRSANFNPSHVAGLEALAGFGAIAIKNAHRLDQDARERRRIEEMFLAAADGIFLVDEDGCLLKINAAACDILGLPDHGLAGRDVRGLIAEKSMLERIIDPEQTQPCTLEFEPGNGRHFIVHIHPAAGGGKTVTMQDVTHFKELDRVKSDFVTAVSHDIRSPLTAVLGYIELIGRVGETTPEQQEFIQRIRESVSSITELIDDLLELSRIEADFDQHKKRLPLSMILQYAIDSYSSRLEESGQILEVEINPDLPEVFGNPIRLRQMVGNLLENAHKYTPRGGTIGLQLRAENDQVILEVRDTGIGIPENEVPFIYNRLFRASNVSMHTPGSGLGLAIVRSIVDNHEGRLWCVSEPGRGSIFTVMLPAAG